MKAVMLAAERGTRLGNSAERSAPKLLREFSGKTLLERHIDILIRHEIDSRLDMERANREVLPRLLAPAIGVGVVIRSGELRQTLEYG